MKYKLIDTKHNIKAFKAAEKDLLFFDGQGLHCNANFISKNADSSYFTIENKQLIYRSDEGTVVGDDIIVKTISDINSQKAIFYSDIDFNDFSLRYELIELPSQDIILDCGRHSNVMSINVFPLEIVFGFREKIIVYNISRKSESWNCSISSFGGFQERGEQKKYEVKSIIGIWNDLLLVQLSNFRLISLELSTGNLKHDLLLVDKFATEPQNYLSTSSPMLLDAENSRIVWLSNSSLIHIDLIEFTPKLVKDYFNVPKENLWRFNKSTLYNGYLFFTGDYGMEYAVSTRVGVLNPETGEVLWQMQLEKTGGLSSSPQVTDDKLYVLGSKGALHIFEKET